MPDVSVVVFILLGLWTAFLVYLLFRSSGKRDDGLIPNRHESLLIQATQDKVRNGPASASILFERYIQLVQDDNSADQVGLAQGMIKLAECYVQLGRYPESDEMYAKVIKIWENLLFEDKNDQITHIDYAILNTNFGRATEQVSSFYERVLDYRGKKLGLNHPDTVNSLVIMSKLLTNQGRNEEAAILTDKASELREGRP